MAERVEFVENPVRMPFAIRAIFRRATRCRASIRSGKTGNIVVTANLSSPGKPAGQSLLAVTYGSFPSDGPSEKVKQGGRTITLWPANQKAYVCQKKPTRSV